MGVSKKAALSSFTAILLVAVFVFISRNSKERVETLSGEAHGSSEQTSGKSTVSARSSQPVSTAYTSSPKSRSGHPQSIVDVATGGSSKLHKEKVRNALREVAQFAGFTSDDKQRAVHILSDYFLEQQKVGIDEDEITDHQESELLQVEALLDILHERMLEED